MPDEAPQSPAEGDDKKPKKAPPRAPTVPNEDAPREERHDSGTAEGAFRYG